jgi:two-component system sensor histidine kinase/response regulator
MAKARVLVVEDEGIVALNIQSSLESLGYDVPAIVASGEEAIGMAEEARPDVVLMDVMLSGTMDGVEAAGQIRERFHVPVIFLTAYTGDDTLRRAEITEPFGYLVKPFDERELRTTIEIALYKHLAEERLRHYAAELEVHNEELDAFAQTVAHDLKNPLHYIVGYVGLLNEDYDSMSDEMRRDCLQIIARSVCRLANIIDELLLLAEVRKMDVKAMPLDMASIAAQARERLAFMIGERQAEVTLSNVWPVALGYEPWVEEVWVNYLSNALKYGGQPPQVELGATAPVDGTACFWVRDNGPGLTEEEQARLFTPFTRLGQVRAEGHGLGLSIVRRIVEKLGGRVGVESEVGQGSEFYFTLPAISGQDQTTDDRGEA